MCNGSALHIGVIYAELLKLTVEHRLNFMQNLECGITKYDTYITKMGKFTQCTCEYVDTEGANSPLTLRVIYIYHDLFNF
jgi:hypothetical protein